MNAKARTARQICKARQTATRNERRSHTMASHAVLAGVPVEMASGVGGALRVKAKQQNTPCKRALVSRTVKGQVSRKGKKLVAFRYGKAAVLAALIAYKPRAAKYIEAKATMLAYVTA
jgi:hypothetical protein